MFEDASVQPTAWTELELTDSQLEGIALLGEAATRALAGGPAASAVEAGRLRADMFQVAVTASRASIADVASIVPRLYQCVGRRAVRLAMGAGGAALRGLKRDWDDKAVEKRGTRIVGRRVTEDAGLTERQAITEALRLLGAKPAGRGMVSVDDVVERRLAAISEPDARRLMRGVTYCDYRGDRRLKTTLRTALRRAADDGDSKTIRFIADLLCSLACYDETALPLSFPVDKVTVDWVFEQAGKRTVKALAIDWQIDPDSVFPSK